MRALVTYGSKRGGTEGVAQRIGEALRDAGIQAEVRPPTEIGDLGSYDAVILGGALYAGRWPMRFRWFVRRRAAQLQRIPVWCFSSGPLDDSAERQALPPTPAVKRLLARIGARGHVTFGGRLTPDARGFPASAMAKTRAGDWRNPEHIRAWATGIARELLGHEVQRPPLEAAPQAHSPGP